ncbi:OmpA family protein [Sphingomonas sp. HF-S3]|uniref:OmpA family protein n=1 Tax=Sphingomonas rustica TaxID=3103142 RepID=A0ABV0BH04_9SPHN
MKAGPGRAGLVLIPLVALVGCDPAAAPLPSLKDQEGYFRPAQGAVDSRLDLAGNDSVTGASIPESSFGPAGGEESDFRLAEVAPDRLEETRTLLTELEAKQDGDRAIRFSLPADILFDFDKSTLRPDAEGPLARAQRLISAYSKAPLRIVGYTDAKGDDAYNDRLSLARANSVAARLVPGKSRAAAVEGRGERDPVAPNAKPDGSDDPAGRQLNRRVEIILLPSAGTPGE